MKHSLFLLAAFMFVAAACTHPDKNKPVVIGKIDSVKSNILGEERKIWIYTPDGIEDTSQHFPVLYLLDGDAHFSNIVGMIQQLNGVNGNAVVPQMIVVGIPNTNRTRDLTPTHSVLYADGSKKDDDFKASGGGEKFVSFLQKELMPYVDSIYHPAPYRMLVGHSFGGLTAMNIVINHTNMFNSYVVIDPSMWWDKQKLLNQARSAFQQKKFDNITLFMGIANTMPIGMDTLQVRIDTTGATNHMRCILLLKDILQRSKGDGLNFGYTYYKNDDHSSVPMITEYDALHFIFSYYNMSYQVKSQLFDKNNHIDVAAAMSAHYADVSKHLGYKVLPPEIDINHDGYHLLQNSQPEKAYGLFMLNMKNYPRSENAYDSMGDYYLAQKDNAKAIEYYKKGLTIKEVPDTRKKLDSLLGKK
ncbi:MAG TPA: alpha/beta hydrolase-fold protein [Mucilaginibacter sp.]|jgi:hypothetical protein|nr:alpha/beta hydrolase-fold protein [Mucilaginibacter sp.]